MDAKGATAEALDVEAEEVRNFLVQNPDFYTRTLSSLMGLACAGSQRAMWSNLAPPP